MSRRSGLVFLGAVACLLAGLLATEPAAAQIEPNELDGSYCVDDVLQRRMTVALTLWATLRNRGDEELTIRRMWLANPANTDFPYARFGGVHLAAGGQLELSHAIEVPREEFERWKGEGAPRLFVVLHEPSMGPPGAPRRVTLARAAGCPGSGQRRVPQAALAPQPQACSQLPSLLARAEAVTDLPDGLRLRFASGPGLLADLARVVENEQSCQGSLRFQIVIDPGSGPVTLEVTGPAGSREPSFGGARWE